MRKLIALILVLVMISGFTACNGKTAGTGTNEVVKPNDEKTTEITIIAYSGDRYLFKTDYYEKYKKNFESKYGVKVRFDFIGAGTKTDSDYEAFNNDLAAKLHVKNGPELIHIHNAFATDINAYIDQGAVLDAKDIIPNMSKIYSGLLNEGSYYVPIGVIYDYWSLSKKILEELEVNEPGKNWTRKEYYDIYEKWIDKYDYFTSNEILYLIQRYSDNYKLYGIQEDKVNINTPEFKSFIKKVREEILSGKYKLPNNYTYENYYNMLYEARSDEQKLDNSVKFSQEYKGDKFGEFYVFSNKYKAVNLDSKVILPNFSDDKNAYIYSLGFLLNKNGNNTELACEFVNGLLDKEFQMGMFKDENNGYNDAVYYSVIEEFEKDIRQYWTDMKCDKAYLDFQELILDEIKSGRCRHYIFEYSDKETSMKEMITKDVLKFIFADTPLTDEELNQELKRLEEKYNIYLNE